MADDLRQRNFTAFAAGLWLLAPCGAVWCGDASGTDPMRPSYARPAGIAGRDERALRLQAVFGNELQRVAVISGHVVVVGGRIGVMDVIKIDARQVELRGAARPLILKLPASPTLADGEAK